MQEFLVVCFFAVVLGLCMRAAFAVDRSAHDQKTSRGAPPVHDI
jgi:hypothetical protein